MYRLSCVIYPYAMYHVSCGMCYVACAICHVSCVMCQVSRFKRHVSCVMFDTDDTATLTSTVEPCSEMIVDSRAPRLDNNSSNSALTVRS
jgi:hypothetical protein